MAVAGQCVGPGPLGVVVADGVANGVLVFWILVKIGDQVFRAVLDTGATLSIVAPRLLKTFKKTKTVVRGWAYHPFLGGGRCYYMPGRQNRDPTLRSAGH